MSNDRPYTPGPWSYGLIRPDGRPAYRVENSKHLVAKISSGRFYSSDPFETAANARLISAAPDLFEALDMLLDDLIRADLWGRQRATTCKAVCDALKKAREGGPHEQD